MYWTVNIPKRLLWALLLTKAAKFLVKLLNHPVGNKVKNQNICIRTHVGSRIKRYLHSSNIHKKDTRVINIIIKSFYLVKWSTDVIPPTDLPLSTTGINTSYITIYSQMSEFLDWSSFDRWDKPGCLEKRLIQGI